MADEKAKQLKIAANHQNMGWGMSLRELDSQALDSFFQALKIREQWLGKVNLDTGKTYYQIAMILQRQNQLDEALVFFRRAYRANCPEAEAGIRDVLQEKDMNLQSTEDYIDGVQSAIQRSKSGAIYHERGDYAQALWDYQMELALQESAIGKYHPDTADIYCNIADVYHDSGDPDNAIENYQNAAMIYQASLGENHPTLATVYVKLAEIHMDGHDIPSSGGDGDRGGDNYEVAGFLYRNALSIYKDTLGISHPDTIKAFSAVQNIEQRTALQQKQTSSLLKKRKSGINDNSYSDEDDDSSTFNDDSEDDSGGKISRSMILNLKDSMLCPCCQVNQFSSNPSDEFAPLTSSTCGHSICRSCVQQSPNTRCPMCKAYSAFPKPVSLQKVNRSLCDVIVALEKAIPGIALV